MEQHKGGIMQNPYKVSDEIWEVIKPHISVRKNHHPRGGGRPRVDDRKVRRRHSLCRQNGLSMERIVRNRDMLFLNGPFAISAMDGSRIFSKTMGNRTSCL